MDPETAAALRGHAARASCRRSAIFGEIEKLLLKARRPSIGFALLREWGMLRGGGAGAVPLADTPQDPEWHPEGDVWTHTLQVIDEAARLIADLRPARARWP